MQWFARKNASVPGIWGGPLFLDSCTVTILYVCVGTTDRVYFCGVPFGPRLCSFWALPISSHPRGHIISNLCLGYLNMKHNWQAIFACHELICQKNAWDTSEGHFILQELKEKSSFSLTLPCQSAGSYWAYHWSLGKVGDTNGVAELIPVDERWRQSTSISRRGSRGCLSSFVTGTPHLQACKNRHPSAETSDSFSADT